MINKKDLLTAVIESPDDDAPRLAYADWLRQHGEHARAEFIRGQVQLARHGCGSRDKISLWDRIFHIQQTYRPEWTAEFSGRGVGHVDFRRGFVELVDADARAYLRAAARWHAATPLRWLTLCGAAGCGTRLSSCVGLDRLNRLEIRDSATDDGDVINLVRGRPLGKLTNLVFSTSVPREVTQIGDRGLRALVASGLLEHVKQFWVTTDGSLTGGAVAELAAARPQRLEGLCLLRGNYGDRGALALAGCPTLGRLNSLVLSRSDVGDEGLVGLLTSPSLPSLSWVCLIRTRVTERGLTALAGRLRSPRRMTLELDKCPVRHIDPGVIDELCRDNPSLSIRLVGCPIPRAVRAVLARRNPKQVCV